MLQQLPYHLRAPHQPPSKSVTELYSFEAGANHLEAIVKYFIPEHLCSRDPFSDAQVFHIAKVPTDVPSRALAAECKASTREVAHISCFTEHLRAFSLPSSFGLDCLGLVLNGWCR